MCFRKLAVVVALAFIGVLSLPTPAWAYIDPGLGSYLFQIAIAGFLASIYTLRHYTQSVTGFLRRGRKSSRQDTSR